MDWLNVAYNLSKKVLTRRRQEALKPSWRGFCSSTEIYRIPPLENRQRSCCSGDLDHMHPDEAKAVEEQQLKQKVYHDRHAKDRQVNVGDPVYVTNFSSGPCWLPGVVVNKSGPVSFIVKLLDDRTVRRHQDHVRARRAQHFPEREVYDDVSERPIVGVVPAISTDQRVTESGSGEESSAATAATNASAAETTNRQH